MVTRWKKKDLCADVLDPKNFNTYYKVFIQYVPNNENTLSNERNPCKRIKRKKILIILFKYKISLSF